MKKTYLVLGIALALVLTLFLVLKSSAASFPELEKASSVEFYRSESCGCCSLYQGYLGSNGNPNVKDIQMRDISSIKTKYKISTEMQSCHTTIIGNYFVEGHIPLEAVEKLLREKPNVAGIAMPGMPSGSPGMPGSKEDFVIYAVNSDGSYQEFMRM